MTKAVQKLSGLITIIFAVIILFTCCRKTETLVGRKLIPGTDYVNGIFTDTLTLKTKTVREDSILTENIPTFVLGAMNDGVFGKSYAGIYSQLILSSAAISFGDTAIVDSTVLSLNLTGVYGDTNSVHNFRVFTLKDSLYSLAINYQSPRTFALDSLIGTKYNYKIGKTKINTAYTDIDAAAFGSSLRIPVSNALGQQILNQSPTGAFTDNSTFLQYFKGIYVDEDTTVGVRNSMVYVSLQTGQSFLGIYYHTPHLPTTVFRLWTNGGAINTDYFHHNYHNKMVQTALANATKSVDTSVYVQSMAGVKTWVTIPYLNNLGKILINKAEVEVTMAASNNADTSVYATPPIMQLVVADSLYRDAEVLDQTYAGGFPIYGGTKYYFTDPSGHKYLRYKFSVAGELQKLVNNLQPYSNQYNGFYIINSPSNQTANRIILGGGSRNGDPYQMRLNLVYTKIP